MRILVATDGSEYSEAATKMVMAEWQPKDTEIRVLNVVDLALPIPTLYATGYREESLREAEEVVHKAEVRLLNAGYKVETAVEEGDPKTRIIEDAAKWKADIVVLGCHGRKGLDRFFMGSVSDEVSRYAPCTVEIVRASAGTH